MDEQQETFETGCCPRFDPEPWDEREIKLEDTLFIKDRVCAFLHIPIRFGRLMKRNTERIDAAGARAERPLMLCDEKSLWHTDVYIAVTKEVPGAKMRTLSGTFLAKVFEGPFKNAGKWHKEMDYYVRAKGSTAKRVYTYYTTCPACAKAYGKNYTVLLAEV